MRQTLWSRPSWVTRVIAPRKEYWRRGRRSPSFSGGRLAKFMTPVDYIVVAVYLFLVVWMGGRFSAGQKSLKEFFLGSRNIPWWAAACSGIATMVSAIGYLGAPGQAFASDWTYLQQRVAWPIAIFTICILFLPFFYRLELYTAYEYLEKRFDLKTRLLAGTIFILMKCLFASIAIYAPALIVAEITGVSFVWIVLGVGVLTTLYTTMGGMRAVIWTDTIQFLVLFGGVIVAYFAVVDGVEGGFREILAVAGSEGKLHFLDWSTSFTTEFTVWGGLIGGTFFLLSQYAVDQAELQRFLTTSSIRNSRLALISTMVFTSLYGIIVFFIGSALFVFYIQHPEQGGIGINPDRVFPKFIIEQFPTGLRGILIAGVFAAGMSTVSSVLNSLATVMVRDFYEPLFRTQGSVKLARWATLVFGIVATFLSLYAESFGTILVAAGKIRNFFGGSLIGVFLLGMLAPRVNGTGAFLGVVTSFAATAALSHFTDVSWMWYGAFATAVSFAVGLSCSNGADPPAKEQLDGLVWQRRHLKGKV